MIDLTTETQQNPAESLTNSFDDLEFGMHSRYSIKRIQAPDSLPPPTPLHPRKRPLRRINN